MPMQHLKHKIFQLCNIYGRSIIIMINATQSLIIGMCIAVLINSRSSCIGISKSTVKN